MSDHEQEDASFDDNVKTLNSMGIEDEEYIRKVLRQTSNDLEQACHILFPDDNPTISSHESYDHLPECGRDMEMQDSRISQTDSDRDSTTVSYSLEEDRIRELDEGDHPEDPPPSYEESIDVDDHQQLPPVQHINNPTYVPSSQESDLPPMRDHETRIENSPITEETTPIVSNGGGGDDNEATRNVEFPLTNYYELEARVHTEQWSIPYKREESLAKCMLAATDMMREGANVAEADENCVKFLTRTMPCSFEKLLTHEAVAKWDESIMKGIREMVQIMLELISVRLTYKPIPIYLLDLLAIAFNANATFHTHNRSRSSSHQFWVSNLGEEGVFGQSPSFTTRKDPKGWLVEFMNFFAFHNGIARIRANILDKDAPPTLQELTALFNPFSACDDYIIPNYFKAEMSECMRFAMHFVEDLKDDLLKDKEVGCVFDLLKTLKTLFRRCGGGASDGKVDNLRLKTTLRMFQIPHYNAKMNALKEVVRLTEEPYAAAKAGVKNPIATDKVMEWLINNKVLSIAFGGNLHQAQYCDKVKSIVEFLGNSLSLEELSNIWEMQVDKNPAQVENIHNILAYAASRFNTLHMDHLFQLIQKSWEAASSDSYREKLLGFIGKIGKDDRTGKTAPKILNLLWSLAHSPQLSREMVELALNSHYSILIDSYHVKDTERRLYIGKCADDIKKCQWVVAAISHLHRLAKGMYNSRHGHKDQQQVADLQKQYDLLRVTAATLTKIHSRNVQQCQEKLTGKFVMDGHYTHEECVDACLQFMSFLLRDGALYLPTKRAIEIWDILISNEDTCADDRRLAFKWFDNSMGDLEYDTQYHLFTKKVLKVDPILLDIYGYRCVRNFFENINLNERKLRKLQHSLQIIVDSPDLTGLDYLWKAALEVPDKNIADELISSILQISYSGLNQKLKRDPVGLHQRFIDDCFTRLDSLCEPSAEDNDLEKRTTCIERLLLLAQRYILTVEEMHSYPRQIPPHGSCFRGNLIRLSISIDQKQRSFYLECHTNETVLSVRRKIAKQLNTAPENVQIGTTEKWLSLNHFNKLLHQLGIADGQILIVKLTSSLQGMHSSNFESSTESPERLQAALKQEKILPGVLMSSRKDVYDKLESLCASHDPRIQIAVRNLLSLIPINTKVLEGLEIFTRMGPETSEDSTDPKAVLEDFYSTKNISATELLYNLEVLSGKLIPSSFNSTDTTSQIFRKNFLEAGGLKYIIDVFQNSAFPLDTNILIIQDCYVIALSLIRFLLCDPPPSPDTAPEQNDSSKIEEDMDPLDLELEGKPSLSRQMSKTRHVEDEVARLTIETMTVDDFKLMLTYLTEVCWVTAAGRLDLITAQDKTDTLSAGICSRTDMISHKDITISCQCFELLVTCLNLRKSDIPILYKLPKVEEFLMDVLIGSASSFTRGAMMDYLHELCDNISIYSVTAEEPIDSDKPRPSITEIPHYYFLHLLLSNPSSLWKHNSTDPDDLVTWARSNEYFEFLVLLLKELTEYDQKHLEVDINKMIQTEIEWLGGMSFDDLESHGVQVLLAGHLKLCTALFSCEGVDKKACSGQLIHKLLNEFLFPASLTQDNPEVLQSGVVNVTAKCHSIPARVAAYGLLVELSKDCVENYKNITGQLIMMHHSQRPENRNEWEFRPLVDGRSRCGFVGLKNAGATCYMNSVLQQLYVQPGIREKILEVERDEEDASILPEIQTIFGHLMKSNLQYYTPDVFWKNFKLEGRHINVLEHQDASEFFSSLTDQVDEALKKREFPKVFEGRFGGQFLDQIICHGCEHRFEKEQGFTTLQLSVVQSKSLVESLQEFVRGDMLEGDNRYLCGECDEKRDTLKRTCLKTLPPVLVVHLKRFDYDWETNREIKFNNYFEFPWYLDLEPYTADGITSREKGLGATPKRMYELTGIIVHQGQASAGHYYAFIKDKKRPDATHSSNEDTTKPSEVEDMEVTPPNKEDNSSPPTPIDRWIKFNDTIVEEYVFTDVLLEAECFGGSIKTSSSDPLHNSHPETKVRHWNAYMLFYEAVDPISHINEPASEDATPTGESPCDSVHESNETSEEMEDSSKSTPEVQKEEVTSTTSSRIVSTEDGVPLDIQRSVNVENLRFMQNRDIYCRQYFDFIWKLVGCNELATFNPANDDNSLYGSISIELITKFLLHTFFRAFKDLRKTHKESWVKVTEKLLISCPVACEWLIEYFSSSRGDIHLKPFLLECSTKEVREDFTDILSCALHSYCASTNDIENDGPVNKIISFLLQMLEGDVIDSCKTCAQYFNLLRNYANHRPGVCHLLSKDTFSMLTKFLLGTTSPSVATDSEPAPRRWSSVQVKEFGGIYGTLALMIRNSDFSIYESENVPNEVPPENPYMIPSKREDLLPPSEGMHDVLFVIVNSNSRFIKECSHTLRESDIITTDSISSIFCYCCWNNQTFSASVIGELQSQIYSVPATELRSYFRVLMDILLVEDSLQEKRITFTFKGSKYDPEKAIFKTIRESNESKRVYQGIKFLVGIANKSKAGRSFIMSQSEQLQSSVTWLKKKVNEYSWSSSSAFSNESSSSKVFKRSISSQDTLEEASALLHELESRESKHSQQQTRPAVSSSNSSHSHSNGHNSNDIEG